MDPHTSRRRPRALVDGKKRLAASFVDGDESAHFCTRIGCSGRLKYAQNSSYYHSSPSTGTSARMNAGKSSADSKRNLSSQLTYAHSNSSLSTDSEIASSTSSRTESKEELQEVTIPKRRVSVASLAGPQKPFHRKAGSMNQNVSLVSSARSLSRSSGSSTDPRLLNSSGGARLGQRNLCSSSSDSPRSFSSPGSKSFSTNSKKKRSVDAESSSSRVGGKTVAGSSLETQCLPCTSTMTTSGVRKKGNSSSSQRGSSSGGKMPMNTGTRTMPPENEGSHAYAGAMPTTNTGIPGNGRVGQRSLSTSSSMSYILPRGCSGSHPTAMTPSSSLSTIRFNRSANQDFLQHYDMNGAAEILLALERIEQDEDMTPEQMLLEMSLLLSSLSLDDQHQDMRLDIDSMSYGELLALEERMGSVSTPLSEEELLKCLKRSIYQHTLTLHPEGSNGVDIKCSICQEEYVMGDKMGMLSKCCHQYHETCISQWLRLKNWCPICKASAATSQPSSSQ